MVFCNALQNNDTTDIASLQDFVSSLESCRTLSEGADKLYRMCNLFCQVAKLYLQARMQDSTTHSQAYTSSNSNYYTTVDGTQLDLSSMSQFDPYLSALGLMPNTVWPPTIAGLSDNLNPYLQGHGPSVAAQGPDMPGMGHSSGVNSVQDWFSGSRYLMNMMEVGDDSQMPDINL